MIFNSNLSPPFPALSLGLRMFPFSSPQGGKSAKTTPPKVDTKWITCKTTNYESNSGSYLENFSSTEEKRYWFIKIFEYRRKITLNLEKFSSIEENFTEQMKQLQKIKTEILTQSQQFHTVYNPI